MSVRSRSPERKKSTRAVYKVTAEEFKAKTEELKTQSDNLYELISLLHKLKSTSVEIKGETHNVNLKTVRSLFSELKHEIDRLRMMFAASVSKRQPRQKSENAGKALKKCYFISDQFAEFIENSNFGNGLAFGLVKLKNVSVEEKTRISRLNTSTTEGAAEMKAFIKEHKDFYDAANAFITESGLNVPPVTKKNVDEFLDVKSKLALVWKDRVSGATFGQSLFSILHNVSGKPFEVSPEMKKYLLKSDNNTNFVLKGVRLTEVTTDVVGDKFQKNLEDSELPLGERVSVKNGKTKKIIDNGTYTQQNIMIMVSTIYRIPKELLTEDQQETLVNKSSESIALYEYIKLLVNSHKDLLPPKPKKKAVKVKKTLVKSKSPVRSTTSASVKSSATASVKPGSAASSRSASPLRRSPVKPSVKPPVQDESESSSEESSSESSSDTSEKASPKKPTGVVKKSPLKTSVRPGTPGSVNESESSESSSSESTSK